MHTSKTAIVLLALVALEAVAPAVVGQGSNETAVTGIVTDTWCGRKGANAQHAEHARRTVASGVAQYALYVEDLGATGDEASKRLYILEPQATAAQYAGQRVKITGTLGATPLTRAGQSYAPDAVAAYKDPSAPVGLRSTGATASGGAGPSTAGAVSGQAKVQSHEAALDQTTPIAGVLTIVSIVAEATPVKRRAATAKQ